MIYAVNKRTKEHHVVGNDPRFISPEYNMVVADPDGWVEWQSSEYEGPMPAGARCEIRLSSGDGFIISDPEDWDWSKGGDQWIVAYRPVINGERCIDVTRLATMAGPDKYRASGGEWPEPPAWTGDGLPPVGCEADTPDGAVLIKGYYDGQVWYQRRHGGDVVQLIENAQLRPIRSEEDRAIDAMREIFKSKIGTDESIYESLYDAIRDGKIPGVKLENT